MNVEQNFTAEYTHPLRSWVFYARKAYSSLRAHKYGNNSAVISEVTGDDAGKVIIKTLFEACDTRICLQATLFQGFAN